MITYDQDRAMVGGWVGEGKVRESVLDLQRPVELVRTKWRPGHLLSANHVLFHCTQWFKFNFTQDCLLHILRMASLAWISSRE